MGSRRIANGVAGLGLATWPHRRMPPTAQGGLQSGSLETEPEAGMRYTQFIEVGTHKGGRKAGWDGTKQRFVLR